MISVAEALLHVLAEVRDFGTESLPLESCHGRILAEDVYSDRDFPPFNRVTMDGIAINSADWAEGRRTFHVAGLQAAGQPRLQLASSGTCLEVMTGAVLPEGADAVIPYEDCQLEEGKAALRVSEVRRFQNVHLQGTDSPIGTVLLRKGSRITPGVIATLATVGQAQVRLRRLPAVAICSTGDELVNVDDYPAPHQIRRSNSHMIAAALKTECIAADLYHMPDQPSVMKEQLTELRARYDVLLFSGAVSKGRLDFLPEVLSGLGMETLFHRVAQRPGKPMLFGRFRDQRLIMGFPGNPVSTMVCYAVFFLPWLYASLGISRPKLSARLTTDICFKPALTGHILVRLGFTHGILEATPCTGGGSGDLVSLHLAGGFITLPAEMEQFKAGTSYPMTLLAPII